MDTLESAASAAAVDDEDGAPIWSLPEGSRLPGGFQAWERLGVGNRTETWLVWSPRLWTPAVLKLPRPHLLDHPRAARALIREVAALRDNAHPVLPRLYADGLTEAVPYIAFEYVDGPTLADEVEDTGPLVLADVAMLGVQLLTALRVLHQRGLAHVDLKPENVVLRDGRPVLIDFGSAREIGAGQPAGRPVGTEGYASPEMEACAPISPAMDVYALGMTLREALTGAAPSESAPDLPWPLARLCDPDPAGRPSAEAGLSLLAALLPADARPWPDWA